MPRRVKVDDRDAAPRALKGAPARTEVEAVPQLQHVHRLPPERARSGELPILPIALRRRVSGRLQCR